MRIESPVATLPSLDWLYYLRQGKAFVGAADLGASVGNYSEIQLLNPNASGVTAYVKAAWVASQTAGMILLRAYDTALATDKGALANLLLGGAAGQCHVRTAQPAGADGVTIDEFYVPANQYVAVPGDWVGILNSNKGIVIVTNSANQTLYASFRAVEL